MKKLLKNIVKSSLYDLYSIVFSFTTTLWWNSSHYCVPLTDATLLIPEVNFGLYGD